MLVVGIFGLDVLLEEVSGVPGFVQFHIAFLCVGQEGSEVVTHLLEIVGSRGLLDLETDVLLWQCPQGDAP